MKRIFDFLVALVLLVPALVVVTLAAAAIRLDSPGSPIFLQARVGRHLRIFKMVKLRTMLSGTAVGASHEIGPSRVTRVGGLLRRTKIDELPQILSVLTGAMSFVGPRPCLPVQRKLIEERARRGVFDLRPGITGKAQVMGVDMSQPIKLAKLDAKYRRERTFVGDIAIILATIAGRGFYDAAHARSQGNDS